MTTAPAAFDFYLQNRSPWFQLGHYAMERLRKAGWNGAELGEGDPYGK